VKDCKGVEMNEFFDALWVEEQADRSFRRAIVQRTVAELPAGDLLIQVHYSSLNYKDALSASGNRGVTRTYPHTPGIDAAGVVVESAVESFQPGDEVIVIGYDLGMNTPGGFGGYIRVPATWAVKRPAGLTLHESMALGTAGFTAAQSVDALLSHGVRDGEVLVTGATGGVGSIAVALLSHVGLTVVAATGKRQEAEYLRSLGAAAVIDRTDVDDQSGKALLRERWAGVVDTVGGSILATAIKATRIGGAVAACGNVASPALELTVYPFILRGVKLLGIDSVNVHIEERRLLWERLAGEWKLAGLDRIARDVALVDLDREIDAILHGQQRGRVVVVHAASAR
jgi:putative YhdH/YhfP family quinone oxidoreductase